MQLVCNIVDNVNNLLPHFFSHYMGLGVDTFNFAVNRGTKNPCWNEILSLSPTNITVNLIQSKSDDMNAFLEGEELNVLIDQFVADDGWVIPTDFDEFHVLPEGVKSFQEMQSICESKNNKIVFCNLIDRITKDGHIPPTISLTPSIFDQFPQDCFVTRDLMKSCATKICFAHKSIRLDIGHHWPKDLSQYDSRYIPMGKTYHFKWFGKLLEREVYKLESYAKSGYKFTDENNILIDYLVKNSVSLHGLQKTVPPYIAECSL
jgi:hypothetical protein